MIGVIHFEINFFFLLNDRWEIEFVLLVLHETLGDQIIILEKSDTAILKQSLHRISK